MENKKYRFRMYNDLIVSTSNISEETYDNVIGTENVFADDSEEYFIYCGVYKVYDKNEVLIFDDKPECYFKNYVLEKREMWLNYKTYFNNEENEMWDDEVEPYVAYMICLYDKSDDEYFPEIFSREEGELESHSIGKKIQPMLYFYSSKEKRDEVANQLLKYISNEKESKYIDLN